MARSDGQPAQTGTAPVKRGAAAAATSAKRATSGTKTPPKRSRAARPPVDQPPAETPVDGTPPLEGAAVVDGAAIHASFRLDDEVRAAIADNLQRRGKGLRHAAQRAETAFEKFDPSPLSDAERARSHFLASGGNLRHALDKVIEEGAEALRKASGTRSISLRRTDDVDAVMTPKSGKDGLVGRIGLGDLQALLEAKLGRPTSMSTVYTACEAEVEANRRIAEIEGGPTGDGGPAAGASASGAGTLALGATALVKEQVNRQMRTASSPETELQFNVPARFDQEQVRESVESLELRDGASDVTAFHDFSNLQIAFKHVWTELFDGDLEALGKELFEEYVNLDPFNYRDPRYPPISTVEDLKNLMVEIRKLFSRVKEEVPADAGGGLPWSKLLEQLMPWAKPPAPSPPGSSPPTAQAEKGRVYTLLESLDKILASPYAFKAYAKDSINFGTLVTYRQTWEPKNYQVGELVSTIPLAPKEIRRYTTRKVTKKTRNVKELEDSLQTRRTESSDTSRADAEIVDKAQNTNTFNLTAHESLGGEGYKIDATQNVTGSAAKESAKTKRDFRESVVKSAQEYRQQHRVEIDSSETAESEETAFHEIQNPNDELAVTYLFYELQRQYQISERLYKLTPVVLVANEVPRPNTITDAWLVEYDWILRRVILDDSFRPAIEYLTKGFVGAELNIRILEDNARAQKQLVEQLREQIQAQMVILAADEKAVLDAVNTVGTAQKQKGVLDTVKGIFDPIGITGKTDDSAIVAAQSAVDYARETLDRATKEKARLLAELGVAVSALQNAVDKLAAAVKEHYDRVAEIDRLRVHVKDNILYYMQAIWSHEPPDQRFFRIYQLPVPIVKAKTAGVHVDVHEKNGLSGVFEEVTFSAALPMPELTVETKTLVEVADLDTVLGYKGNYAIYGLNENNYITLHMMQDYLELADEIVLRDPDEFGNYTLDDLQRLATCLKRNSPAAYNKKKGDIKQAMIDRLTSGRPDSELIVVPTSSLYIEALVGTHPLLEDFKLVHRALDVKKVQAEVRHAELENVRLASRALKGKDDDPDIEKKIVVEAGAASLTVQPDGD